MDKDTQKFLTDMFSGRAALYEFLSLIFKKPPQKDFIGISKNFIAPFNNLAESSGSDILKKGVELLIQYVEAENDNSFTEVIGELNNRYTALFLLGFSSVMPTASTIMTPGCVMRQEPWERTKRFYNLWGYKMPADFREPEDHISAQLRFMEKMSLHSVSLVAKDDNEGFVNSVEAQHNFLKENMVDWVTQFNFMLSRRSNASKCSFTLYEAGGFLAEGYIKEDIKLLNDILQ